MLTLSARYWTVQLIIRSHLGSAIIFIREEGHRESFLTAVTEERHGIRYKPGRPVRQILRLSDRLLQVRLGLPLSDSGVIIPEHTVIGGPLITSL